MKIPPFVYPFDFCWAFVLLLVSGSYEGCCCGLTTACVSVNSRCVPAGCTPPSGLLVTG